MPRSNADLLAQATASHPEYASVDEPNREPDPRLEQWIARRDLLLKQPSLERRETRELALLVEGITRAEDGRRKPIRHGAPGYRRGCKCQVCLDGHAKQTRERRQRRERAEAARKTAA